MLLLEDITFKNQENYWFKEEISYKTYIMLNFNIQTINKNIQKHNKMSFIIFHPWASKIRICHIYNLICSIYLLCVRVYD